MNGNSQLRICLSAGIILLFIGTCVSTSIAQDTKKLLPASKEEWLYVGGSGQGNYTRIQDAIDNASDGNTIFVFSGIYYEHIVIDILITLIGENKNTTIIDGTDSDDNIVTIKANGISIEGFTIRNPSEYYWGICVNPYCNGVSIINNIIKASLLVQSSHNTNISRNLFIDIPNNEGADIVLTNASENTLSGNLIIQSSGDHHESISVYANSDNNNIFGNTISKGLTGIGVGFSSRHNKIYANSIKNCEYGIYLSGAMYTQVNSNIISDNNRNIFLVWYTDHTSITNNTISNSIIGIRIEITSNLSNNTIYHNNFINNSQHVYIPQDRVNIWDNGYPSCGNYWDDYDGEDIFSGITQNLTGSDGVGDTPYPIPSSDGKDMYPLMEPYGMTMLSLDLKGGLFKCSGIIKNTGTNTAFTVQWKILVEGGFVLVGRDASGTLPTPLLPGEERRISTQFMLGFGSIILTIAVWADNAPYFSKATTGTLLLFIILL